MSLTLAQVVELLDARYPQHTAESWDAVGLVVGDPEANVNRVHFAVDPVTAVVDEALARGADLLVTHHPLLLDAVHGVPVTDPRGALVHRLIRGGCALYVAHTNADAAPGGVAQALADVVGLVDAEPLLPGAGQALDKHVVFVPTPDARAVLDAMADAGAGTLGEYERCAWTTTGTGTFVPGAGANPTIGASGRREEVDETRVEVVAPRAIRAAVVRAMVAAHPYEEPAFDVLELATRPGSTGHGRVGRLAEPTTLRDFAQRVADVLPATATGIRVSGDLDAPVQRVAVVGGSGSSMFDAGVAQGVDVFVTSDVKHHPASELREAAEHRAAAGAPARPAVIDTAHFASEWPWLPVAARTLADEATARQETLETFVSHLSTDPWTARFDPRT